MMGGIVLMASCHGAWWGVVLKGNCTDGELSLWGIVLMGNWPDGELYWCGIVMMGNCTGVELS